MIDFACPNEEEVELLKQHYHKTPGTVSQRAHAVLLSAEIIKALKLIKQDYPTRHLCLIWDNASFHRSRELKAKLKTSLKAFYLLNLPPYASDTNPQEHIWEYAKDRISNQQYGNMKELVNGFTAVVMGRNYPYQI